MAEKKKLPSTGDKSLDKDLEAIESKKENKDYASLEKQIDSEISVSEYFIKPKWDEWATRLKLYNNQRRDKTAVGDTLLFTIHQTILASLYDDKLSVTFMPTKSNSDEDTAENCNDLAKFDYQKMEKDKLDLEWIWDTTFFGRGLVLLTSFDRKRMIPVPTNIDPLCFMRDPSAKSVAGNLVGDGRLRYGGYEVRMSKNDMNKLPGRYNLSYLGKSDDFGSYIDQNKELRLQAQGYDSSSSTFSLIGDNATYRVTRWFTSWNGSLIMAEIIRSKKGCKIIRLETLPKEFNGRIPIIDRSCYFMSNSWDNVSIPDLVEDKHRARSVSTNQSMKIIQANLEPRYAYDKNKVERRHLLKTDINRHIPVDGAPSGSIVPVQQHAIKAEVDWIMGFLDNGAQRATATPEVLQGNVANEKRTATEIEKVSRGSDTRYTLSARIFGWSEKDFWKQCMLLYKIYFDDKVDEKVIRVSGYLAPRFKSLKKSDIMPSSSLGFDIDVESSVLAEAKRQQKIQGFQNFLATALADPSANKISALRMLGKKSGLSKEEINVIVPPNIDEMDAESENESLSNNKREDVLPEENHQLHIFIHSKAIDTPAKKAHLNAHMAAMRIDRMSTQQNVSPNESVLSGMVSPASNNAASRAPITTARGMGQ